MAKKSPTTPRRKSRFTVRIPDAVLDAVKAKAKAKDRSASWFVVQTLRNAVAVK